MNEALRQGLADWATRASEMAADKVVLATGSVTRPAKIPSPSLQLTITIPSLQVGQDEKYIGETLDGRAVTTHVYQRRAVITCLATGELAATYLGKLRKAVSKGQFKRLATSLGFEVLEVSSVMDASGVIDTGWEERAVAEITITWSEEESTTYDGTIESAVVTGTADSIDVEVTAP